MPNHGRYTNGVVTIQVNEDAQSIVFASDTDAAYHGHLDFHLTDTTLDISTVVAEPAGQGLGALLLWICSNTAVFNAKTQIRALATARTAIPFYSSMHFSPDPVEFDAAMLATLDVPNARAPHEYVATWIAQTGACLNASWDSCSRTWRQG